MAQLDIYTFNKCFVAFFFISIVAIENVTGRGTFFNGRSRFGGVGSPFGPNKPDMMGSLMGDHWITQKLDNFDPKNNATWKNLYLVNQGFYKPGGPVFLMFRGESAVSKSFMFAGSWVHFARQYNAMLFQLEHRYYGQSFPTKDLKTENMKYLTVEQALGDAANFIQQMNKAYNFTSEKWIAFGGSYGGALVVWMRVRYPNLVYGGVSSSGPIAPVVNFKKYMHAVSDSFRQFSRPCANQMKLGFQQVLTKLNGGDPKAKKKLFTDLKLCDSLKKRSATDISNLIYTLAGFYAYVCQYNLDNTNNNNVTIPAVCGAETVDIKNGTAMTALKNFLNIYLNEVGDSCVGYTYKPMIKQLRETSLTSDNCVYGDRQWMYQQCAELGLFQTSQSRHSVFGHNYPLQFFVQECIDTFGPNFTTVSKINLNYGGLKPPTNNIIAIQGSIDPWRELGYTKNTTAGIMALFIEGSAHVADMYEPGPGDPPGLFQARTIISNYIGRLLKVQPVVQSSIFFDSSLVSSDAKSSSSSNANKNQKTGKAAVPLLSNSTAISSNRPSVIADHSSMFNSKTSVIKLTTDELMINTATPPTTTTTKTTKASNSSSSTSSGSTSSGSSSTSSTSSKAHAKAPEHAKHAKPNRAKTHKTVKSSSSSTSSATGSKSSTAKSSASSGSRVRPRLQ